MKLRERVLRSFSYKGSCWEGLLWKIGSWWMTVPTKHRPHMRGTGTQRISFLTKDTLLEDSSPEAHTHLLVWDQGQGRGGGPFSQYLFPGDTPVI